ncbi:MAG: hypothetical protein GY940_47225, partial [bacterium]|nr:hypothetical protein [bacterium]
QVTASRALKWPQLKKQIDKDQPVGFSWYYERGGGHYMVARGYLEIGTQKWVMVNDPWPHNSDKTKGGTFKLITYNDYVSYPRRYTHWRDHYNITKNTGQSTTQAKENREMGRSR